MAVAGVGVFPVSGAAGVTEEIMVTRQLDRIVPYVAQRVALWAEYQAAIADSERAAISEREYIIDRTVGRGSLGP